MTGQVIVSVSGIRDETVQVVADFAAEMDRRSVPLSLLVAPRLKDKYRLVSDAVTQDWLRGRRDRGDAIVLHGYDQAATKRRRAEFAVLPEHEARLRLLAADRVLEEVGLRTRLFAPPRWVASPGAVAVLPNVGFRLLAGMTSVRDLAHDTGVRSHVIGVGDGFRAEPWRCRVMVLGASRGARRGRLVRLAVSAKQLGRPGPRQAVLDAVDLALHHGADPGVYRWPLVEGVRGAA
ncbi:DUF2334 domain-containing protein [Prescottella equi]|uniref:DUF2334 domain-containing protein n=1 Tax=Rhodococcus hoagii TaxID=43767 RepID=UPI000A11B4F5|nr:DUF2334 domain-containing protein [Prescottella equi]ORL83830.1 deacetylase [Prescottella equi]